MSVKKKLKKAGAKKVCNLVRVYEFDSGKTPEEWLSYFKSRFEEPDYKCRLAKNERYVIVVDCISFNAYYEHQQLMLDCLVNIN